MGQTMTLTEAAPNLPLGLPFADRPHTLHLWLVLLQQPTVSKSVPKPSQLQQGSPSSVPNKAKQTTLEESSDKGVQCDQKSFVIVQ